VAVCPDILPPGPVAPDPASMGSPPLVFDHSAACAAPASVSRGRASATTRSSTSDQHVGDDEHQGDQHPENRHAGLAPRAPVYGSGRPLFHPYRPTRTRQDLPCTSAGEPAPPSWRSMLTITNTGEGAWPHPNPPWDDGDRPEPVMSAYGVPPGSKAA
jgi:hypothetical protein